MLPALFGGLWAAASLLGAVPWWVTVGFATYGAGGRGRRSHGLEISHTLLAKAEPDSLKPRVVPWIALFCATASIFVAGCIPGPPAPAPTIALAPVGGPGAHNSTITATTGTGGIDVASLTYIVSSPTGTTYFTGAAGQQTTLGFTVEVRYVDSDHDTHPSVGDVILVLVTPAAGDPLSGGSLKVLNGNTVLGMATLP